MLLGRTAILDDMVVSPTQSCAQKELSYDLYQALAAQQAGAPSAADRHSDP
jgi:hypothetical protein